LKVDHEFMDPGARVLAAGGFGVLPSSLGALDGVIEVWLRLTIEPGHVFAVLWKVLANITNDLTAGRIRVRVTSCGVFEVQENPVFEARM